MLFIYISFTAPAVSATTFDEFGALVCNPPDHLKNSFIHKNVGPFHVSITYGECDKYCVCKAEGTETKNSRDIGCYANGLNQEQIDKLTRFCKTDGNKYGNAYGGECKCAN